MSRQPGAWSRLPGVGAGGSGYRRIEHSGDLCIEVEAPSPEGLFETAGRALFDVLLEGEVRESPAASVRLRAADRDLLLADWLNELLYLHSPGGWALGRFEVRLDPGAALTAQVWGERFDASRHRACLEIKAATLHGLRVQGSGGVWRARVIFDL